MSTDRKGGAGRPVTAPTQRPGKSDPGVGKTGASRGIITAPTNQAPVNPSQSVGPLPSSQPSGGGNAPPSGSGE